MERKKSKRKGGGGEGGKWKTMVKLGKGEKKQMKINTLLPIFYQQIPNLPKEKVVEKEN